ncbi:PREDICTED: uncharacterized protein LOC107356795 [Acropora digitifera]|uniref:uncharacterized protein LOC107356795 n=1 Tax=Acropora digitifera TaxID=70779 RepID=UPI00077A72A3|nr:PREDICTED: uncharacterized protein LOC107356795 [Acropora digitifera]
MYTEYESKFSYQTVINQIYYHVQIIIIIISNAVSPRNENKKNKVKKHEKEKEFMKSLKSVSVTTSYCGAGHDTDSELESSDSENSEELSEPDNCIPNSTDSSDDKSGEEMSDNLSPLYFPYDCEGTGGSIYKDHIVEIAASLQPLPSNLHVKTKLPTTFQSLVNTSKRIAAPVVRKCGIKQTDLLNKPKLSEVLPRFISWIKNLTDEVSTLTKRKYFPGTYTTV